MKTIRIQGQCAGIFIGRACYAHMINQRQRYQLEIKTPFGAAIIWKGKTKPILKPLYSLSALSLMIALLYSLLVLIVFIPAIIAAFFKTVLFDRSFISSSEDVIAVGGWIALLLTIIGSFYLVSLIF